jgi:hypothetical protein
MSASDAAVNKAKIASEWNISRAEHIVETDPNFALEELSKEGGGAFKDVPIANRDKLKEDAAWKVEKIVAQNEELQKMAISQGEDELVKMKIARQLTPSKVKEYMDVGKARPKFADEMIRALNSPKTVKAKTKDSTFTKLAADIFDTSKKQKDTNLELLVSNSTGDLSDEDFDILYTFNQQVTTDTIDKAIPKQKYLWGLAEWGKDTNLRPEIKARMFKAYMQRVNAGEEPAVAVDAIIKKEILNLHPQAASYPKEGKKTMDAIGVLKMILPIGAIVDAVVSGKREEAD